MNMKRIAAVLCALIMLLSLAACKPREIAAAEADEGPAATALTAAGRYVEREIRLPAPQGEQNQYPISVFADGENIAVIAAAAIVNGDDYQARYHRYTISPDGAIEESSEAWLNDCAPTGGNDLGVIAGEDGKLYLSFTDYDAEINLIPHIFVSEDGGATGRELTGDIQKTFTSLTSMGVLADGSIAAMDFYGGASAHLDAEGKKLSELDFQNSFLANCTARGESIASAAPGGKAVRVVNASSGDYKDFDYTFNDQSGALVALSEDGAVYLADAAGISRHTADGTLWERLIEGDTCALGLPGFYPGKLFVQKTDGHDTLYVTGRDSLFVYGFDATAAAAPEKGLTVFSLTSNETVRQALVKFSRQNSNVHVTYKVAMDGETAGTKQDYIKALNTELLAGTGPDILILDGLPLDSYIEKDVLVDLSGIVAGAEPVLSNIKDAFLQDGRLYAVPTGFLLPLAVGADGAEKAFADLTTLRNAAEAENSIPLLSYCAFNYETLASYLLKYYGDTLLSGKEADIADFLGSALSISAATGCTGELGRGWSVLKDMPAEELQDFISSWIAVPQYVSCLGGKARAILSHPLASVSHAMEICAFADVQKAAFASVGGKFLPVGLVGVNKASAEQETAADFVKMLLSYEAEGGNEYASQFPVNAQALKEMLDCQNDNVCSTLMLDDGVEFSAEWPTAERRAELGSVIDTLHTPIMEDEALTAMLLPEITACLSGEISQSEAAGRMQSLLSTYLAE